MEQFRLLTDSTADLSQEMPLFFMFEYSSFISQVLSLLISDFLLVFRIFR